MSLENYPTLAEQQWKWPRYYVGKDWRGYCVLISRTRDSGLLDQSNWESALEAMEGKPGVEVTRFRHWGFGWGESIMVAIDAPEEVLQEAESILCALADYPSLDDSRLSQMEYDKAIEAWRAMDTRERAKYCRDAGVSIFAARRDKIPSDCFERIREDYCQ